MEEPFQTLLRVIITGILLTHANAQLDFMIPPPIPYVQNEYFAYSYPYQYPKILSEYSYNYPIAYSEDGEYDYVASQYKYDDYYPYDYSQNQLEGYNYFVGLDSNYDYKTPIQILPSRLPPPLEKLLERLQNYFSTYNYPDIQNAPYIPDVNPTATTAPPVTPSPATESTPEENVIRISTPPPPISEETTIPPEETTEIEAESTEKGSATDSEMDASTEVATPTTDNTMDIR